SFLFLLSFFQAPAPTVTSTLSLHDALPISVAHVNRVDMSLLKGIDRVRDVLVENTERFARGLPANNALLWGARGMGKSSLVKARSEEHTSELQSPCNLVCRLLLEKKKNKTQ